MRKAEQKIPMARNCLSAVFWCIRIIPFQDGNRKGGHPLTGSFYIDYQKASTKN